MPPRLTIVLPLKGRPLFTLRFLWHANRAGLPYRFLIADGEVRPPLARVLENPCQLFPNLDINYIRYPDDIDFHRFFFKMADATARVTTPYAMLADNDDFLLFSGIERSLDFLDATSDYVCCGGGISGISIYSPKNDSKTGLAGPINKLTYRYAPADQSIDIGSSSIGERLSLGLRTSWCYYAVYRSAELATIHRELAELDLSDLQLHERYCTMRALTLGKARSDSSTIAYMRQYGTSMHAAHAKDWIHHLIRNRFSTDFALIAERISRLVAKGDGSDQGRAAEELRSAIEPWLRNFLRINYGYSATIRSYLRKKAPSLVKWLKARRRFSVPIERRSIFTNLKRNGASETYLQACRADLSLIEEVIRGDEFRNFLRSFDCKLMSGQTL